MKGSITRRGSSWVAVHDEPSTDGKRRQRSRSFKVKREAQAYLADALSQINSGTYSTPSKVTVSDYVESQWLPAIEGSLRPLSFDRYQRVVRLYINPNVGGVPVQRLTAADVNALHATLEANGLGVATRKLVHAVLGRAMRDAERWGLVQRNVVRLANGPGRATSRATAWTTTELRAFLDHVMDDALYPLWRTAATTGMRRGELAGLTWQALDLDVAKLTVSQQLIPTTGGLTFGPPKSARSRRTIALDAETVQALRDHQDRQMLERALAGDAYADADLVFADALGGVVHPQRLTEAFSKHRKAAGISTGSLHVLRHTAATLALSAGVPLHIVAARLGDDPRTILQVYAHLLNQGDEAAAHRLAEAIA